jgi:hypothetical protein
MGKSVEGGGRYEHQQSSHKERGVYIIILITNVIINSCVQVSLTVGQVRRGSCLKSLVMSRDLDRTSDMSNTQ